MYYYLYIQIKESDELPERQRVVDEKVDNSDYFFMCFLSGMAIYYEVVNEFIADKPFIPQHDWRQHWYCKGGVCAEI